MSIPPQAAAAIFSVVGKKKKPRRRDIGQAPTPDVADPNGPQAQARTSALIATSPQGVLGAANVGRRRLSVT